MQDFLTIKDACELTGAESHHVRYLIRKGRIPATKIGGSYFIPSHYYQEEIAAAPDFIPEARRAAIRIYGGKR